MSFCKFSSEYIISNYTILDNIFLSDYMPYAPDACIKVFLYGLYQCGHSSGYDNTIESFAKVLNLNEQDILSSFAYWQEQGLVQVLSTIPIEIRYMPIRNAINNIKKYNPKKYSDFNAQTQEIIEGRMITPSEYNAYYDTMAIYHIQPEALLMIMKYCTNIKGKNVGYKYIITVAKNWAMSGITTSQNVEQKISEHERNMGDIKQVLNALKIKRSASFDEMQSYIKWTTDMQFDLGAITNIAKRFKGKGGFERLNAKLLKYYELKLFSLKEIEDYEEQKDKMYKLAREINKIIGVYYENVETIVENYLMNWIQKGYDEEALKKIATYCFKQNIRTLAGMNNTILKFYKLGITNLETLNEYTNQVMEVDGSIKEVLAKCGIQRGVTSFDRDYYRIWTKSWHFNDDVILYAANLANNKNQPLPYMNKILSVWYSKKIQTIEDAKAQKVNLPNNYTKKDKIVERNYSGEELKALFDNIDNVEV